MHHCIHYCSRIHYILLGGFVVLLNGFYYNCVKYCVFYALIQRESKKVVKVVGCDVLWFYTLDYFLQSTDSMPEPWLARKQLICLSLFLTLFPNFSAFTALWCLSFVMHANARM